jgi:hypothetical protein
MSPPRAGVQRLPHHAPRHLHIRGELSPALSIPYRDPRHPMYVVYPPIPRRRQRARSLSSCSPPILHTLSRTSDLTDPLQCPGCAARPCTRPCNAPMRPLRPTHPQPHAHTRLHTHGYAHTDPGHHLLRQHGGGLCLLRHLLLLPLHGAPRALRTHAGRIESMFQTRTRGVSVRRPRPRATYGRQVCRTLTRIVDNSGQVRYYGVFRDDEGKPVNRMLLHSSSVAAPPPLSRSRTPLKSLFYA